MRLLKSRNASMVKTLVSTSAMFSLPFRGLRRKRLPAGFSAKWNQEQTNREGDGGQRDGNSERLKMLNARADEKGDPRAAKSRKGRRKSKGARAALGWILLGQPQRINRKIRAAKTKKEKTDKEPGKGCRYEIKDFAKCEGNEGEHQGEVKGQRSTSCKFFREPGHREASENGGERNKHGRPRSELRCRWSGPPCRFGQHRHCCGNVHRSGPETANGGQHEQRIQNRSTAQCVRKKNRKRSPDPPLLNDGCFLLPTGRLGHAVAHPS